ncbi:DNA mismatch repair protein MutL [Xylaria nigripes]|nr:DNA mismatch repair protein MutL [Xylaria nigripes]
MATIKPIEAKTVHQIQSGQVIVDLCSVVKELVENSIDAGATNIEVRFKNQGLDVIEVQDNGSGISKENYHTLALKHYTSKLSTYSDLESLETFGFRGEALSSLCALSKFTVTTCLASDAPKGSRLEFETSGKLRDTTVVAAQKGTTVSVHDLFHNLPVRRRELERNIKREWNKVLVILNQYACIQTGLKFSVSQQPNKGKRMVLFSTKGNQTTRENIVNVFGAKTLAVLIPLDLKLELEPTHAPGPRLTASADTQAKTIRVRGHVSRPAHGEGRQTPDRQMFFVNGRPCGLPQFAKVFNEVYKSYNASQSPFIFADIQLDTHLYDVNVSPDKRTILLHDQTRMLDNLRELLGALFESQDYALPTSQLQAPKQSILDQSSSKRRDTPLSEAAHDDGTEGSYESNEMVSTSVLAQSKGSLPEDNGMVESVDVEDSEPKGDPVHTFPRGGEQEESPLGTESLEVSQNTADFRARLEALRDRKNGKVMDSSAPTGSALSEPPIPALAIPARIADAKSNKIYSSSSSERAAPEVATITIGDHTVTSIIGSASKKQRLDNQRTRHPSERKGSKAPGPVPSFNGRLTQMFAAQAEKSQSDKNQLMAISADGSQHSESSSERLFVSDDEEEGGENRDQKSSSLNNMEESEPNSDHHSDAEPASSVRPDDLDYKDEAVPEANAESNDENIENDQLTEEKTSAEIEKRTRGFVKGSTKKKDATYHLQQTIHVDEKVISDALNLQQKRILRASSNSTAMLETDRLDREDAEEKLSLSIAKSDFEKMKIIGQFNLGFILASRTAEENSAAMLEKTGRDDELFIIDQHATDEKYNFERLQANTVVQSQKLVNPKTLELTAVEEDIVQQNIDALETNGFVVSFDDSGDQPVGSKCQLLSLPLSRETTFSLADLEELISLLQDHQSTSANTVPRPSKVRKMFAMRACRSSVMIGKSLSTKQMEKLVRHMGELDKPWNCPHGRPTMRHLCGLGAWDGVGWKEGDDFNGKRGSPVDWAAYLRGQDGHE